MLELSPAITRQYIDAVAVFDALAEATEEAAQVRGGMYWHAGPASAPESKYLVRTSPAGAETSLGPRTPETQAIYDKFMQRKQASAERLTGLKAALELGRRLAALSPDDRPQVTSPDDVANLLQIEMAALEQEQLRVVLLDTKHRILGSRTVYQGSVNQAQVRIGEIYRDAVRQNATAIVAVHNHPSGDPTPSAADVSLTVEMVRAGEMLDIDLLDHLIIGQGRWLSLRRLGLGFPKS